MARRAILAGIVFVCLMAGALFAAALASAAPAGPNPPTGSRATATWTPSAITSTQPLAAGESFTATATFTSSIPIVDTLTVAVSGGSGAVRTSPTSFAGIQVGQVYTLTVVVTNPGGRRQVVTATITLRDGRRAVPGALLVRWQPPRQQPPHVDWNPQAITSTVALSPGATFTTTTTFTVTQPISNVAVLTLHGRRGNIAVSPASFDSIQPGRVYSVDVGITAPASGQGDSVSGTVWLRQGGRGIANPLPVHWHAPPQQQARISWTPAWITSTVSLAPGDSFTTTVTFSSTQAISNVQVLAGRHSRGGTVTVTPTRFSSIEAGQTYTVVITVTAPLTGRPGLNATVSLHDGRRMLPVPLPVAWRPS